MILAKIRFFRQNENIMTNKTQYFKLITRGLALILAFALIIFYQNLFISIFTRDILFFKTYHLVWAVVMIYLIAMLIPRHSSKNIGAGKAFARNYKENSAKISGDKLKKFTRKANAGAKKIALFWLALLTFIAVLFYSKLLSSYSLILISILFVFLDSVFINFWCPFRVWVMRNKCCNACQIYYWGPILAFSHLVFIVSFWTYSIVFVALLVLIQWEYLHQTHPERFSEIINANLMCDNCKKECPNCNHSKINDSSHGL